MNIFLTGYRCTGKSTVGKALEKKLKWPLIDADTRLVDETGITISEMVAQQGWDAFRKKESEIIRNLCTLDEHIVATGGGVILNNDNVLHMQKSGKIVWLRATPETIKKRIMGDETTEDYRPSLTSKGLLEEIEEVLFDRNPLYEKAMDFHVDTDRLEIDEVCRKILAQLCPSAYPPE